MTTSKRLTIFEGPDGAGKSTAAQAFAKLTGAKYVHFSAMPGVIKGLGRMYVEAMLPALLGYQDLVFDRCWLSDVPYGTSFRGGMDRLGDASRRMLERLALRCGAVVIQCDPGWESVVDSFRRRRGLEMLKNESQLQQVHQLYEQMRTGLPLEHFNYHYDPPITEEKISWLRTKQHPLGLATAGNWEAPWVLVGESFAERKDQDAFYQWPFASFSSLGCSQWLTDQLAAASVRERDLLWVNADQDLNFIRGLSQRPGVIALGENAADHLSDLGMTKFERVVHPSAWKRFHSSDPYHSFINILRPGL